MFPFRLIHPPNLRANARVRYCRSALFLAFAFLFWTIRAAHGFDIAYWVWQREQPLNAEELEQLAAQQVHTIYWHIGELENNGETWRWKARYSFPPANNALRLVPVVRLVSREHQPFSTASTAALLAALAPAAKLTGELQLDYDAPDRLLVDYAAALNKIHETTKSLTITALPHWSRPDRLRPFENCVDELFPMLYDFEAEPFLQKGASPQPIIAPEKMIKMLGDWSRCAKPWRAGLPAFSRLTIYDPNERSHGQIRNWNWDEVCLNPALLAASKLNMGAILLRASAPVMISNTRLRAGDQLAVRLTDCGALRDAIETARQTNARGAVLFRLPDSAASSGWSLEQLSHLDARPALVLRKSESGEALIVQNAGAGDLAPRFQVKPEYGLEIAADSPFFREAEAGDFARVTAYTERDGALTRVALPFATHLVFTFSQLRAKQSLQTGLIQLAPGATFRHARYRFLNFGEEWKPLE
jgi:hypothetical protein